MAVLPPYSKHALPSSYQRLMVEDDSEIIDFYPTDFKVDVKGKRFAWLGEVLLPLIDPDRLKKATCKLKDTLTEEEMERNKRGDVLIFRRIKDSEEEEQKNKFQEVKGTFKLVDPKDLTTLGSLKKELQSHVVAAAYDVPDFEGHKCELLKGVKLPVSTVRDLHDYERRNRVSEACIRIIDQNFDRQSLRELEGVAIPKRLPDSMIVDGDEEMLAKPTKKVKTT